MLELITRFLRDEEGQGLAEYALILVLIAIAVIGVLGFLGDEISFVFENVKKSLKDANK